MTYNDQILPSEHLFVNKSDSGQKFLFQVILNDFFNVKINSQKMAATRGYWG